MARGRAGAGSGGPGAGQGVIVLPAALTEALTTGGRAREWSDAERDMLRAAYPLAARNGTVRKLAEMWPTLGKGFPVRTASQLRNKAEAIGCATPRRPLE